MPTIRKNESINRYRTKINSENFSVVPTTRKNFEILQFGNNNNARPVHTKTEIKIQELRDNFKLAKDEQGIFGKVFDCVKNLFRMETGSDKIESTINKLSQASCDEDFDKVSKMINEYREKQDLAVDTIATTSSAIVVGAAGAKVGSLIGAAVGSIIPGAGTVLGGASGMIMGAIGGAIVGAASNVFFNQLENMTDDIDNNSWHNDKNITNELTSGAILGSVIMLTAGINSKISGVTKNLLGINKSGVVLASNGSASCMKTIGMTALAEGLGGAASTTIVSDGKYLIECAIDDEKDFSAENLIQTTVVSGITGGVISAGFGAFQGYNSAVKYNNEFVLRNNPEAVSSIENNNSSKTSKVVKKNIKSLAKRNLKSSFKKDLTNIMKKYKITFIKSNKSVPVTGNKKMAANKNVKFVYEPERRKS